MHGIVFTELKAYVEARLGPASWAAVRSEAGLAHRVFLATDTYPDTDLGALVTTAARLAGHEIGEILEDFGEFMLPQLLHTHAALVRPDWRTLEFLENVEEIIHRAVRLRSPGAEPPDIWCERPSPSQLIMTYSSDRMLCSLARGLIMGVARHYGEQIRIEELSCMVAGADRCQLKIDLAAAR